MTSARFSRYSKVARRLWIDEGFRGLSAAPPNAQTLWLRLLTGPELTNIPGLIPVREAGLADVLGWPLEGFREAFREVCAKGWTKADWKAGLVWLPNAPRYNKPESPNVVRSWRDAWIELPECQLKREAFQVLKAFAEGWGKGFAKAFAEALAEGCAVPYPHPSPNQEQEQEQEKRVKGIVVSRTLEAEPPKGFQEDLPVGNRAPPDPMGAHYLGAAWAEGVECATGHPCAPPTPSEVRRLVATMAVHAPAEVRAPGAQAELATWLRGRAGAFAAASPSRLNVWAFVDWLNGGQRTLGGRIEQQAPAGKPRWSPKGEVIKVGGQGR